MPDDIRLTPADLLARGFTCEHHPAETLEGVDLCAMDVYTHASLPGYTLYLLAGARDNRTRQVLMADAIATLDRKEKRS